MLTVLLGLLALRIVWTVVLVAIALGLAKQESDSGWGSIALFSIGLFPELLILDRIERVIKWFKVE